MESSGQKALRPVTALARAVEPLLTDEPQSIYTMLERCSYSIEEIADALLQLELAGRAASLPRRMYVRAYPEAPFIC